MHHNYKTVSISIILPVYNTEQFLNRCIDSITGQSFRDFELIIIDDGSTDLSSSICSKYSSQDPRISLFHTLRKGVSNARMIGMEKACGKYIYFMDSDDWLENETLLKLFNAAESNNADITACNFTIEYKGFSKPHSATYKNKDEYLRDAIANNWGVLWKNLIRRDLALNNDIVFHPEFYAGEDYLFMIKCISSSQTFAFIDECLYHYNCTNKDSISSKRSMTTCESHRRVTEEAANYLKARCELDLYEYDLKLRKIFVKNLFFYFGISQWYSNFKDINNIHGLWNPRLKITISRRFIYSLLSLSGYIFSKLNIRL